MQTAGTAVPPLPDLRCTHPSQRQERNTAMKAHVLHAVALGSLLALTEALPAAAMNSEAAGSIGMGHGSTVGVRDAVPSPGAAARSARPGVEIRKAAVSGFALAYTLIDMQQMMRSAAMPMTHGSDIKMTSHHLMVYAVGPDGRPATNGKAGFSVVRPDGTGFKTMTMPMQEGFGADLDLVDAGDYRITARIALADRTLMDEFVYTVK